MLKNFKIIFLDIDGVLNSYEEGSYMTHEPKDYGFSEKCLKNLMHIIDACDAYVIISSNWRKFDAAGKWSFRCNQMYQNPLPKLENILKNRCIGRLPPIGHLNKSQVLQYYFEQNNVNPDNCKYVIFDDDVREGFNTSIFKARYIQTNPEVGLTDNDVNKAITLLNS